MANKNQPMPVDEWLATRARELVQHMQQHHRLNDTRAWEQHIGELLQEETDRLRQQIGGLKADSDLQASWGNGWTD